MFSLFQLTYLSFWFLRHNLSQSFPENQYLKSQYKQWLRVKNPDSWNPPKIQISLENKMQKLAWQNKNPASLKFNSLLASLLNVIKHFPIITYFPMSESCQTSGMGIRARTEKLIKAEIYILTCWERVKCDDFLTNY